MSAASASRGRRHRHRRPGPARGPRRRLVIGRFRRRTKCRRVSDLPVSCRLLGLHAFPRSAELPSSNGSLPKGNAQAFGISRSQFQAARTACQHLLPNANSFAASLDQCLMTGDCPQAVVQQALTEGRKFAQCMRNHGVSNWPDPTLDSMGRPSYQVTTAGISINDTRSAPIASKIGHCESQTGAPLLRQE